MKRILVSATIALSTLVAGAASAGGSVSLTVEPQNASQAKIMKIGLGLYAAHEGIEAGGHVSQAGDGNAAGLHQSGNGHLGVIEQDGDNHTATLSQNGAGHACGIFQYGEGTSADVSQSGHGDACLVVQAGWQ
ncbi:hypothetical protein [Roseovarius salis]|uniref:hypothetical protein n=1 Tax=Roseovarius salis TaxID=3376063 RepID=UPI0037C8FE57